MRFLFILWKPEHWALRLDHSGVSVPLYCSDIVFGGLTLWPCPATRTMPPVYPTCLTRRRVPRERQRRARSPYAQLQPSAHHLFVYNRFQSNLKKIVGCCAFLKSIRIIYSNSTNDFYIFKLDHKASCWNTPEITPGLLSNGIENQCTEAEVKPGAYGFNNIINHMTFNENLMVKFKVWTETISKHRKTKRTKWKMAKHQWHSF